MSEQLDPRRLEVLRDYKILDTFPEARFERLTRLAIQIFDAPISTISLLDKDRQWFKSHPGLEGCENSLDVSFCKFAVQKDEVLVVLDATKDPRFLANPLVTGEPRIRFYAGAPLRVPGGTKIGTLCIIDPVPRRSFSFKERSILKDLASLVVDELELRRVLLDYSPTKENRLLESIA
jgi:GAF domain-containing protein